MVSALGCPAQFSHWTTSWFEKKLFDDALFRYAAFPFNCSPGSRPHQRCHYGVATTSCGKGIWKKWKVGLRPSDPSYETSTTHILLSCNQSLLWMVENIVGAIWKLHFMSVSLSKIRNEQRRCDDNSFRPQGRILPTFDWFLFWLRLIALLLAFSFHDNVRLFVACSRLSDGGKRVLKIVGAERKPFSPRPTNFSSAPWNRIQ